MLIGGKRYELVESRYNRPEKPYSYKLPKTPKTPKTRKPPKAPKARETLSPEERKERTKKNVKTYYEANKKKIALQKRVNLYGAEAIQAGFPPEVCDICNRPSVNDSIHFDHCHKTGKFRGWLCSHCNRALGMVYDSPELLRKLADYLEIQ